MPGFPVIPQDINPTKEPAQGEEYRGSHGQHGDQHQIALLGAGAQLKVIAKDGKA